MIKVRPDMTVSNARRIRILFKKYKKAFRSYYELAKMKEPILLFIRKDRHVEYHENATKGVFKFQKDDGKEGKVLLNGIPLRFEYGPYTVSGYIAYEEELLPYPSDPLITADFFESAIKKIALDMSNRNRSEMSATGKMAIQIAIAFAIGIFALIVWKIMVPADDVPVQIATNITQNASSFIGSLTPNITF